MPIVAKLRTILPIVGVLMLAPLPTTADTPPEVTKLDGGWYKQRFKSGVAYLADTVGQGCFASTSAGITEISCKLLKRRAEWDAIIQWVKPVKSKY